jgi:hypothetical protein
LFNIPMFVRMLREVRAVLAVSDEVDSRMILNVYFLEEEIEATAVDIL